jgi:ATPase subunit of ABC transporter with duplicated ATPase domains
LSCGRALAHFPRTVAVVGHDRFFIDKIATRLPVVVGEGCVLGINGNWTTRQAATHRLRQCPFSKFMC